MLHLSCSLTAKQSLVFFLPWPKGILLSPSVILIKKLKIDFMSLSDVQVF